MEGDKVCVRACVWSVRLVVYTDRRRVCRWSWCTAETGTIQQDTQRCTLLCNQHANDCQN